MAKRKIIPLFIPHFGCPNGCVFCDQKKITGMGTSVTPEMVRKEIEEGLSRAGDGAEVAFYGGSFTAIPIGEQQRLLEAAAPFVGEHRVASIRVSTRPDAVDVPRLRLLKQYGVTTVELGCQSMDERVLDLAKRGHSPRDTVEAVKLLRQFGFQVILQMMTGLPGDTGKESLYTAEQIAGLKPDGVRIYPTVVLKGTELENMMNRGEYRPHDVDTAVELCARVYRIFLDAEVPVIRLGLNPTELLSSGMAVAGAYHPALGEKVLSRLYFNRAEELLRNGEPGQRVIISVHPSRVSVMVGQKRENILALEENWGLSSIKVVPEGKELWEITLKK